MAARSHSRGWPILWDGGSWIYTDTGQNVNNERKCRNCGYGPTPEGYDACIGYIPGVRSVCCGHGINEGIIVREEG